MNENDYMGEEPGKEFSRECMYTFIETQEELDRRVKLCQLAYKYVDVTEQFDKDHGVWIEEWKTYFPKQEFWRDSVRLSNQKRKELIDAAGQLGFNEGDVRRAIDRAERLWEDRNNKN